MQESRKILEELQFCVIDLETTGGNLNYDKIIEIGLVRITNLQISEQKDILINPEIPIPQFVQKLTSISEKDTKDAPLIDTVIDEIIKFIGNDILVAHNTSFDIPFLNSVLRRQKKPQLKNKVLCTNIMTKYLIPEMMNSNLPHLCKLFQIKHEKAHRALSDARSTAKILLKYLEIFIEKDIRKINQLYYPRNKFELDQIHLSNTPEGKVNIERILKIKTPFVFSVKGQEGVLINIIPYCAKNYTEDYLNDVLKSDWQKISIKMIGHTIQGLIHLKDYYQNLPQNQRERTLQYLETKFKDKTKIKSENFDFFYYPPPRQRSVYNL